jgi:copper chaperone CopZ
MMKKLFFALLVFLLGFSSSKAQVTQATLQASGLTCAMCAKSVYTNLTSLGFVESVDTDLNASAFVILFKKGVPVDLDALSKKVEDAGFSVASLKITALFKQQNIQTDAHVELDGNVYHFVNVKPQQLSSPIVLRLIDQHFVSTKEFKKFSGLTKMECMKTGKAEASCAAYGIEPGRRVYHLTL